MSTAPGAAELFPLFHLSDLNFPITSDLSKLTSAQLALAPWSSNWNDSLEKKVARTWRQRREKHRSLIGKVPIGIFASKEERHAEQWPKFELIDVTFPIPDDGDLSQLSSAQLAVLAFHPNTNKDLIGDAEDTFYARRERDFALGLSVDQVAPVPPSQAAPARAQPSAPVPPPALPSPTPTSESRSGISISFQQPAPANVTAQSASEDSARRLLSDDDDVIMAEPQRPSSASPPSKTSRRRDSDDQRNDKSSSSKRERDRSPEDDLRRSVRSDRDRRERDDRYHDRSDHDSRDERSERQKEVPLSSSASGTMQREKSRDTRRDEEGSPSHRRRRDRSVDSVRSARPQGHDSSDSRRRRPCASPPPPPLPPSGPKADLRDRISLPVDNRNFGTVPYDRLSSFRTERHFSASQSSLIPHELEVSLWAVYISPIVLDASFGDLRQLILANSQIAPVALKKLQKPIGVTTGSRKEFIHAFAAFLVWEDADNVVQRLSGYTFKGEKLTAQHAASERPAQWRWLHFDRKFIDQWEQGNIDIGRPGAGGPTDWPSNPRGLSPPPPSYPGRPPSPPQYRPPPPLVSSSAPLPSCHYKVDPRVMAPREITDPLYQLFVSNLPYDVTLDEARSGFENCEGLLGVALGTPNFKYNNCAGWLIFSSCDFRDKAKADFTQVKFDRMSVPMYMEKAEDGNKKKKDWRWLEMSKGFRTQHGWTGNDDVGFSQPFHQANGHQRTAGGGPPPHQQQLANQYNPSVNRSNGGSTNLTPINDGFSSSDQLATPSAPAKFKVHPSRMDIVPNAPAEPFTFPAPPAPPAPSSSNSLEDVLAGLIPIDSSQLDEKPSLTRIPDAAQPRQTTPTGPRTFSIKGAGKSVSMSPSRIRAADLMSPPIAGPSSAASLSSMIPPDLATLLSALRKNEDPTKPETLPKPLTDDEKGRDRSEGVSMGGEPASEQNGSTEAEVPALGDSTAAHSSETNGTSTHDEEMTEETTDESDLISSQLLSKTVNETAAAE